MPYTRTVALLIGAATHFLSRNLSEVQRSVTGQKGFVFFCLFLLGGTEREMSKNWGRSGVRQSSGVNILKKNPRSRDGLISNRSVLNISVEESSQQNSAGGFGSF